MDNTNSKKKHLIFGRIIISLIVVIVIFMKLIIPYYYYSEGIKKLDSGEYSQAIELFKSAKGYKDSAEKINLSTKAQHYTNGVLALSNNEYSDAVDNLIKADNYSDAQQKLQDAAEKSFESHLWDTSILAYDALPNAETNNYRWYALGMQAMENKDFNSSLDYFNKAKAIEGVTEKILEANYNAGKVEFYEGNYESSLEYFNNSNGYNDTAEWLNNTNFMIAEKKFNNKNYDEAKALYKALPSGFSYNNINVADRMNALDLYDYFLQYEGIYNCTYGYIEVKKTSKSYGSWDSWYNNEKDGKLTIWTKLNTDGTVTLEGEAKGYRYTSFSVVSSGVRSAPISAKFSVVLSSKSLPQTLYNEGKMTIKHNGGTNFTFSYYDLLENEDIYFNYKYTSDYKFSK